VGLLARLKQFKKQLSQRKRPQLELAETEQRRCRFETMEARQMLDADPVFIGAVYTESDGGADNTGDTFEVSFEGGADGTELTRLILSGDQTSRSNNNPGLDEGDVVFDTEDGGIGADGSYAFEFISVVAQDGTVRADATVSATVADGSSLLVLDLTNFQAGDKLTFSIDVDELVFWEPGTTDIDEINEGLDPLTSGLEFQRSTMEATFSAPYFESATATGMFVNAYDDEFAEVDQEIGAQLRLPSDDQRENRDRTAGALGEIEQVPQPISISGTVFHDRNRDLVQDPNQGDHGIEGTTLALWQQTDNGAYEQVIGDGGQPLTTQTDSNGDYEFGQQLGLMPGTYRVVESQPNGYPVSVGAITGEVASVATGTVLDTDTLSEIYIPDGGTAAVDFDFAEAKMASISGHVYHDRNDNGQRQNGEEGIADVEVIAIDAAGNTAGRATTNSQGFYEINNLEPGAYTLVETQPSRWIDGTDAAGTVTRFGVGTLVVGGAINPGDTINSIELRSEERGVNYDFGEQLGSIRGVVHLDPNGNCVDDEGEEGLDGVTIVLTDENGQTRTTTTNSQGQYEFADLLMGSYTVAQVQPGGYFHGGQVVGSGVGDSTVPNTLSSILIDSDSQHLVDYNFCENVGSLSGYVYHDRDNDGSRESGEEPIPGVTMRLQHEDGTEVLDENQQPRTAVTNDQGFYEFDDLAPGVYQVVEDHPSNWIDGLDTPGQVDGSDSGSVSNPGDELVQIDLTQPDLTQPGRDGVNYNFGERLGSIEGFVHSDPDGDCEFEVGEAPIGGVTIILTNQDSGESFTTVTAADGSYAFADLFVGTYTVTQVQPANYFSGNQSVGTGVGDTSQPNLISGIRIDTSDVHLTGYNFCENLGELSGYVYHDRDNDGLREPGSEEAIAGVVIRLLDLDGQPVFDSSGQPRTETTDSNGFYQFTNLEPGVYRLLEEHPSGWVDGKETAGTVDGSLSGRSAVNDSIGLIDLTQSDLTQPGRVGVNYNFGERLGSISGRVHSDLDEDCEFDQDEQGLSGITITLVNQDGERFTTVTDKDGNYDFADLKVGTYTLIEQQPTSFFDGSASIGTGTGDVASPNVISSIAIDNENVHLRNYDFCEHLGMLSGHVYHDVDNDGVRENGEDGISGVTVSLVDLNGNPVKDNNGKIVAQRTNSDGFYKFNDLNPGMYRVVETHPVRWLDGTDAAGTAGGVAENPGDKIDRVDLTGTFGNNGEDYDFGELQPGSISGIVHTDLNANCVYEPGDVVNPQHPELREQILSGVTVDLLNEAGVVISTTTTNRLGEYRFDNLRPGVYSVHEIQPDSMFNNPNGTGQNFPKGNGDGSVVDVVSNIAIGSGDVLENYNFCEEPPGELSGYVFKDGDNIISKDPQSVADNIQDYSDGILDSTDTRLSGIVVELRDGLNGTRIDGSTLLPGLYPAGSVRTTTDANGYYEFKGLPAGPYAVFEVQPEGFIDGIDTEGVNAVSKNGVPINRNVDTARQQRAIGFLAEKISHHFDAILQIGVAPAGDAPNNNFSEVAIENEPDDPHEDEKRPPESTPFTHPLVRPEIPITQPRIRQINPAHYGGGMPYTWHLSIVNAGKPRGDSLGVEMSTTPWRNASFLKLAQWSNERTSAGIWSFYSGVADDDANIQQQQEFIFGIPGAIPVTGDFNGDGTSEMGLYYKGEWFVDLNRNGRWDGEDMWAQLGDEHDLPVTGDWDGDGKDDIGIYGPQWPLDPRAIEREPGLPDPSNNPITRPKNIPPEQEEAAGIRVLQRSEVGAERADLIDHVFQYGGSTHVPVSGDWNGDGIHAIGIFRDGQWQLDMNGDGKYTDADVSIEFGREGDQPVVGDFDGNGIDDLGVFRGGQWIIDSNGNRELDAHDQVFELGNSEDVPVVGDWNGDGVDQPGLYREQTGRAENQESGVRLD
jgi:serine-aspartate repeat-containing protein C/D/E